MTELEPQFLEVVSTSAQELRSTFTPLQPGVLDSGDLKVTAGGGTREVVVAAGIAFVNGDRITDQGQYRIRNDAAKSSLAFEVGGITANSSGNPRIDQIICRVFDHSADGSGRRNWRLEVCTGTATAGATLDNRTGAMSDTDIRNAGAIASGWVRLADVLVPAGATTISAGNVRDRRPWARGARFRKFATGTTWTTTVATGQTLGASGGSSVSERIELSNVPTLIGARFMTTASAGGYNLLPAVSGGLLFNGLIKNKSQEFVYYQSYSPTPLLGSALVDWQWAGTAGQTNTIDGAYGFDWFLHEFPGAIASNS